jgi:hypothetical protein
MVRNYYGRLSLPVLLNPLFLGCAFLYGLNLLFLRSAFDWWFFRHYLNDLVCLPLVLIVTIFLQRCLFNKPTYMLNKYQTGMAAAYFAIMFEGVIPIFNSRYTADFWDVICYGFGAWLFYRFGNYGKATLVAKLR